METLVLVIWWLGLLGALAATAVILKEVAVLVGVLRDLLKLAQAIGVAARGVASRAAGAHGLDRAAAAALQVDNAAATLGDACTALRDGLRGGLRGAASGGR
jgi:hypothetical protein